MENFPDISHAVRHTTKCAHFSLPGEKLFLPPIHRVVKPLRLVYEWPLA
ncbi:MAG: hypothetical protein IAE94_00150 [Chthoniobacterales bacterium]|nr:hypothetical protein [Chthoniobacterales bacterium]